MQVDPSAERAPTVREGFPAAPDTPAAAPQPLAHARGSSSTTLAGLLIVDKPLQWSSMTVVRKVRRAAGGVKTGHAGTLDPLATGVVICCLGKATRCVPLLMDHTKVYLAEIDLSAFTATDDREGAPEPVEVAEPPTPEQLRAALDAQLGWRMQHPPAFSAVHVQGKRAYKLARQGKAVTPPPRPVRIDAIELLQYVWPIAQVRITCGKGTYIRSIARDLGTALHTGGHLASLRREAVGEYTLAQAVTAERLLEPIGAADLLPMPSRD